jgi:hypothetical protein
MKIWDLSVHKFQLHRSTVNIKKTRGNNSDGLHGYNLRNNGEKIPQHVGTAHNPPMFNSKRDKIKVWVQHTNKNLTI